jgi:hypothetical protein
LKIFSKNILQNYGSHDPIPAHPHHYNTLPKLALFPREEGDGAVGPEEFSSAGKSSTGSPGASQLPPLPAQPPGQWQWSKTTMY